MIKKINNGKELEGKEWLERYLLILERSCKDFVDVKKAYIKASLELKKVFVHTDKLLEYNNAMMLSNLEFSFEQGLNDNLLHFRNPESPTFLDIDYDEALREKEMRSKSEYVRAETERQKIIGLIPNRVIDVYETMVEYTTFLDAYIPKMAHYYGFITGNTTLKKAFIDYEPDYNLTEKYKEWLGNYLDLNLE